MTNRILFMLGMLCASLWSGDALANNYTLCFKMNTAYTDAGYNEDYFAWGAPPPPASHMKVRISRDFLLLLDTYLDENGCIDVFDSETGQFKVELWGEMKIPASDDSSHISTLRIKNASGSLPKWTYYWTFGSTSGTKTFTFSQSRRTNLIAASQWSMHRFSDGLNGKSTDVWDKSECTESDNSCNKPYAAGTATATVHVHPSTGNSEKFLIAHEIGHSVVAHWFNDNPGFSNMFVLNTGGPACEWSGSHALHSMEHSAGAATEGFAHYYATYVFNDVASFAHFEYYKQEYKSGTVTDVDMENGPTGGLTAYMENVCTGTLVGRGVELDWARQFWDYRSNSGTKPSNYAILRQYKNALNHDDWDLDTTWSRMTAGITKYDDDNGTNFYVRWDSTDDYNGIDH